MTSLEAEKRAAIAESNANRAAPPTRRDSSPRTPNSQRGSAGAGLRDGGLRRAFPPVFVQTPSHSSGCGSPPERTTLPPTPENQAISFLEHDPTRGRSTNSTPNSKGHTVSFDAPSYPEREASPAAKLGDAARGAIDLLLDAQMPDGGDGGASEWKAVVEDRVRAHLSGSGYVPSSEGTPTKTSPAAGSDSGGLRRRRSPRGRKTGNWARDPRVRGFASPTGTPIGVRTKK